MRIGHGYMGCGRDLYGVHDFQDDADVFNSFLACTTVHTNPLIINNDPTIQ